MITEADETSPPRWGLGDAAGGVAVGYGLAVVVGAVWIGVTGDTTVVWGLTVLSTVALWVGLAGAAVRASRVKGTRSLGHDMGWHVVPRTDIPVGIGVAVLAQMVVLPAVSYALRLIDNGLRITQESQEVAESTSGFRFVVLLAIFALGAPLVEELFFRGLLLRSIQHRWGSTAAVALSGAFFGLVHLEGSSGLAMVAVVVSLALLGWALGWLTVHFGRLGPALVAHFAFNAFAVAALLIAR